MPSTMRMCSNTFRFLIQSIYIKVQQITVRDVSLPNCEIVHSFECEYQFCLSWMLIQNSLQRQIIKPSSQNECNLP